MEKKLPKVFKNQIRKKIHNNNEFYDSSKDTNNSIKNSSYKPINIRKKINEIFASPNYIYKANVKIKTKDKTFNERIIGRNKNYLITMDNKTILIDDILDIESI